MKKVSVFTVLTCFLAGAAHFPCYAGIFNSKPVEESGDDDRSKGVSAQPPRAVGQAPDRSGIPSAHPKPTPSSAAILPDLDPALVDRAPADFLAESERLSRPTGKSSAAHNNTTVHGIVEGLRSAIPEGEQKGLVVNIFMAPSAQQLPSSTVPSSQPVSLELQGVAQTSAILPVPSDRLQVPASQTSTPHDHSPLPIPSSSIEHENVYSATRPVGGWALTLPATLQPISIPNSRGQLVRLPKVLDLCLYGALSDVMHPDFKAVNLQKALPEPQKAAGFNLINTYLESYGKKFGQDTTAISLCLKHAVESSNGRPVSFKVCQNKETRTVLFMLHVEGGPVVIGKVPGQTF